VQIHSKIMSNSAASAVPLTALGYAQSALDLLKANIFREITKPHIPAIRHGQPIEATLNPTLTVSTNRSSDVHRSDCHLMGHFRSNYHKVPGLHS